MGVGKDITASVVRATRVTEVALAILMGQNQERFLCLGCFGHVDRSRVGEHASTCSALRTMAEEEL